ncbi:hypothetical protein NX722_15875 [Endozoicomonas gorgoniicola]|uniref:Uncharacterized protein n=1 Tax=Endozoicomonas gorgoniicola TaxID=1234144 RepID=A0ABT3MY93_9GAMM|nr:hypothetical protein [Endozoicomonas gorgoniicola]MCW7554068.1 hypothetical protein [Endozoicomonas gorgoniicola]
MAKQFTVVFFALSILVAESLLAAPIVPVKPTFSPEGCYTRSDVIEDLVNGDSDSKVSFITITKEKDGYYLKGFLWGTNWHVCDISGEGGQPLPARLENGAIVYTEASPKEDINCRLEIQFKNDGIQLRDSNYQCKKWVFACGVHTSIDGTTLTRVQDEALCK